MDRAIRVFSKLALIFMALAGIVSCFFALTGVWYYYAIVAISVLSIVFNLLANEKMDDYGYGMAMMVYFLVSPIVGILMLCKLEKNSRTRAIFFLLVLNIIVLSVLFFLSIVALILSFAVLKLRILFILCALLIVGRIVICALSLAKKEAFDNVLAILVLLFVDLFLGILMLCCKTKDVMALLTKISLIISGIVSILICLICSGYCIINSLGMGLIVVLMLIVSACICFAFIKDFKKCDEGTIICIILFGSVLAGIMMYCSLKKEDKISNIENAKLE